VVSWPTAAGEVLARWVAMVSQPATVRVQNRHSGEKTFKMQMVAA
jgi:hypothetical protein